MNKSIYIFVLFLSFGCGSEGLEKQIDLTLQEIKEVIKPFPMELVNDLTKHLEKTNQAPELISFYADKKSFVWFNSNLTLNIKGEELVKELAASENYGVRSNRFQVDSVSIFIEDKNIVEAELLLTKNYTIFGQLISHGQIEDIKKYYEFERRRVDTSWIKILDHGVENNSELDDLFSLQPKNDEYVRLQKALAAYLTRVKLSDSIIEVPEYRKDSIVSYQRARKALVLHGIIPNDSISDSLLLAGVLKFQLEHGLTLDGIIGSRTAQEMSTSTNFYYKQAQVSLEKWRWTTAFEAAYLFVNIATYKLKSYQQNTLMETKKVVVGTNETRTPELDSKLDYMIAYPYWHVPRSIIEGELVAKAKKDSTYLSRNGYELFKDSEAVNANLVDWSEGSNYKFRQKGGSSNALGEVKFIFPNNYAVYLHDTPSKRFFEKGRRSLSHGCIRVHEPLLLVDYLLKNDSASRYTLDTVKTFIQNKSRKVITLNKKLPIHIRYYTVEADSANNILFYPDIYFKETELMKYDY